MIHVILRTCDRHSLQSTRIVNKKECILRCLNSILNNLEQIDNKHLHIIDDNSSKDFIEKMKSLVDPYDFVSLDLLPGRDQSHLSSKKKSRFSVEVAYKYIYDLPDEDLVYIVEDDYLHYPGAIQEMIDSWQYLDSIAPTDIGIFPQDFNQLYYEPSFPFNETYVRPCIVIPTKTRYYRTTWYTQESFMIQAKIFKKYKQHFDALLTIGDNEGNWEGNTISNVWQDAEFKMFMPMGSLVIHMSNPLDIPFFVTVEEVKQLWESNKTFWSSEQESQVQLSQENLRKWVT